MIRFISILSLVVGMSAFAGELDNERSVTNQDLNGTFVVRVNKRDKSVSFLKSEKELKNGVEAKTLAVKGKFKAMPSNKIVKELDNEAGASSWYYYYVPYNSYYNNCLNWYGYNYYPYYTYNYGSYYYYYYSSSYSRWW